MPETIAVVLPKLSRFDVDNPTSIDTVVRQLVENSRYEQHVVFRPPTRNPVTSVRTTEFRHDNPLVWKRRLKRAVAAVDPVCVEVHQSIYLADYLARSFPQLPVMLFRHNLINAPAGTVKRAKRRRKLGRISSFVFVSEFAARHFQANWPQVARPVHVVPNMVSEDYWFRPAADERGKQLVYMGRPIAVKGFREFCEAMETLLPRHPDWQAQILIYEWERHSKFAQPIIERLRRSVDNVEVLIDRPVAEVHAVAKDSRIAVVPSKWPEPFGLVALEAHLAGLAVVSSGTGGLREISGETARYLDDVSPGAIAGAVSELITDPALCRRLARSGQARCRELFTTDRVISRYDEITAGLIGGCRRDR